MFGLAQQAADDLGFDALICRLFKPDYELVY